MATLKAVRGTRDLLPPETELWNRIETTARQVFARYNFGEIRTPIFEDTALFARSVGEETDIVSKEMYTWEDGERFDQLALTRAWLDAVLAEKRFYQESANPYSPVLREAGVFWMGHTSTGQPEFVCFRASVTSEAIDLLLQARRIAQREPRRPKFPRESSL